MKRALAITVMLFAVSISRATDLRITIDRDTKTATLSTAVALREILSVTITNVPPNDPTALVLAVIESTNAIAMGSTFTADVNGEAVGTLSLNTVELIAYFENRKVGRAEKDFMLAIWDTEEKALLANSVFPILNNPYSVGMPDPVLIAEAAARLDTELQEWAGVWTSAYYNSSEVDAAFQPLDTDLNGWALVNTSAYYNSSEVDAAFQPLDTDLNGWALVNTSAYYNSSEVDAAFQPLDTDLNGWALVNTSAYYNSSEVDAAFQPLDTDLNGWALVNTSAYYNSSEVDAAFQPLDTDLNGWALVNTSAYYNSSEVDAAFQPLMCEQSFMDGAEQAFTGGAGYEVVTNFMANITDASYSRTHSNITVTAAGRYTVSLDLSFATAAAEVMSMHLFTNGVEVVDAGGNSVGWSRNTAALLNNGVVAASKTLTLPASCLVDWRLDLDSDGTLTWNHGTWRIERK